MNKLASSLTNEAAVAHQSGAMEADTIQNGRSSKSQTSRGNIKILAFAILVTVGLFAVKSCKKDNNNGQVPQAVIDKVNEAPVFDLLQRKPRTETIEPGSQNSWVEYYDEDPDKPSGGISRASETDPDLKCHAFNVTWNCETVNISAVENPDVFAMVNPNASVLWPGNLIQGESLEKGVPTNIPVTKRQPGNISLAIVSGNAGGVENKMYRTVEKMQYSYVNQAMNEILSGFSGPGYGQYSFTYKFIESTEELEFELNTNFKGFGVTAKTEFKMEKSQKYTYVLVKINQSFFTMVYDDPAGLDGVFTPDITVRDLENYTGNGNPICYISSVTYGRAFYVLYESTASRDSLSAALNASYGGFGVTAGVDVKAKFKNTMEKTTASVFLLGGNAEGSLTGIMARDFDKLTEYLNNGMNFSANNPGAPISYTVKYLKNAQMVRMNNTMDFTVERCTSEKTENVCPNDRNYIDENGTLQTVPNSTTIVDYDEQTSLGTIGRTTWVRVSGTQNAGGRITIYGDVHLILTDNCHLNASNGGINVIGSNSLTIYAQSTVSTMGRLTATGGSGNAGIGGNRGSDGGNGSGGSAFTGGTNGSSGSNGSSGGTITINGGTVSAIGGSGAAGIGGGRGGNGGRGQDGAALMCPGNGGRGGDGGTGGTITITGGTVSAEGSDAIGGGRGGDGGSRGTIIVCTVSTYDGSSGSSGDQGIITIFGNKTETDLGDGRNRIVVSE